MTEKLSKKVAIGLSGGVDSAVAALLLQESGYDVHAFYMNNWKDLDGLCRVNNDQADAQVIADQLGIPIEIVDFTDEYRRSVYDQMVTAFKNGHVPNPDIWCNKYIKFNVFFDYINRKGYDFLATGHYAQINHQNHLLRGVDPKKDQSYFLCAIDQRYLSRLIFPLGSLTKKSVRNTAKENDLIVADKKDSVGVCFVGPKSFNHFLKSQLLYKPGEIKLEDGKVVGQHDGIIYYTLGQRQGISVGGVKGYPEKPWYVIKKDKQRNVLVISQNSKHEWLKVKKMICDEVNWLTKPIINKPLTCQIRHGGPSMDVTVQPFGDQIQIEFDDPIYCVSTGQWSALYLNNQCVGGAKIIKVDDK